MTTTLELLDKALKKHSASEWSRRYNLTPATFTNAKSRGRLSPALAGNLAIDLGEDARAWMALAAMEAERESPLLERLKSSLALHKPWLMRASKFIAKCTL